MRLAYRKIKAVEAIEDISTGKRLSDSLVKILPKDGHKSLVILSVYRTGRAVHEIC